MNDISRSDLELLIVQPNSFCNISCDYCYLPERGISTQMSRAVFEALIARLAEYDSISPALSVVWHAGEPLVAPIGWYEYAIAKLREVSKSRNFELVSSIQTNGTLVTPDWATLFRDNGVQIGLSIDGPDFIHDAHRKYRSGTGSFSKAMRGFNILREYGVETYNICVITLESLDHAESIYRFFLDNGLWKIGMNFAEVEGVNSTSAVLDPSVEDKVRNFLSKFASLVHEDGNVIEWREHRGFLDSVRSSIEIDKSLSQNNSPGAIISVDNKGNFSTYAPELLGHIVDGVPFSAWNVLGNGFEDMFSSDLFKSFAGRISDGANLCMNTCEYASICGGGSPSNKWFEFRKFEVSETRSCRVSIQAMADTFVAHELSKF